MQKVIRNLANGGFIVETDDTLGYGIHCPGCKRVHFIPTNKELYNVTWDFNGDLENPTFNPSINCNPGEPKQCHFFIRNGKIEFCGDCFHELNGQIVDLISGEK